MSKKNTSHYSAYLSGISSMFDLSYPDKPQLYSQSTRDIDRESHRITAQAFNMTKTAMKQAMNHYENKQQ